MIKKSFALNFTCAYNNIMDKTDLNNDGMKLCEVFDSFNEFNKTLAELELIFKLNEMNDPEEYFGGRYALMKMKAMNMMSKGMNETIDEALYELMEDDKAALLEELKKKNSRK